ncbi:hypothetical protein [Campylobacter avium]|uniref:hypothetical protein n=1 Tax=Campylobacter avium TaxID=522485 RepID=UPI00255B91C7|nr:hypothetical protein [Campylobacter avium]
MNCIYHNEVGAIGSCNHCSVGLCAECINSFITVYNKPLCKSCSSKYLDEGILELKQDNKNILLKMFLYTASLIIGIAIITVIAEPRSASFPLAMFGTFILWALTIGMPNFGEDNTKDAVREAVLEAKSDGYFLFKIAFKLIFTIIYGMFFPIVYVFKMITWGIKLSSNKKDINRLEDLHANLA